MLKMIPQTGMLHLTEKIVVAINEIVAIEKTEKGCVVTLASRILSHNTEAEPLVTNQQFDTEADYEGLIDIISNRVRL